MAAVATRRGSRRRGAAPVRSAAKDTLDHFRRFAATLRLIDEESGELVPFELEDFQAAVLEDYYAGCPETLIEIPSGNGKTTLFAAVALHHGTYVRRDCRALILSSSGKQAQQMYEAAAGFVDRSRDLSRWWAPQMYGLGRVKSLTDRGMIEIVSPSPKVAEGEVPSLVLADELHRFADDGRAYSILASKLQKRRARILAATTAGDDEESYFGRRRRDALTTEGHIVRGHLVDGKAIVGDPDPPRPGEHYTVARDPEGHLAYHEWSLPEHLDTLDLEEVKRCNPARFVTEQGLYETWKRLRTRPWDWSRQHCNRWELGEQSAIDATAWRDAGSPKVRPLKDKPFWVGFDMGGVSDSTAVIPVWRDDDEDGKPRFVTCRGVIVWPPADGEWTLLDDVLEALDAVVRLPGHFQGLVFDPAKGGGYVAQELERRRRWRIIEHTQAAAMDDASDLLARLVVEGRIRHDDNPEVTRQVLAAAAKKSRRNRWYLAKPASQKHRKIDAAVALAMACRVAAAGSASVWERRAADDRPLL